ncbi:uncharacterized protein LOC131215577 [Anopheles bellator]|uniref:uncharacterized protein LOC131215577 n=1 Tax=Anopheles bellator TaxID=139047 RepID=UPI002649450C|nr:uncharacterized protein LOC131215577 [Anopheles bellator]
MTHHGNSASEPLPDGSTIERVTKQDYRIQGNVPGPKEENETNRKTEANFAQQPTCSSEQVGILKGTSPYERVYQERDEILKHLISVYLYTILKSPTRWTEATFAEIVQLETTIASSELLSEMPIRWKNRTYNIRLTNTLIKGRFGSVQEKGKPSRPTIHQALDRIKRGKAAIWKCGTNYFLVRRLLTGYYFYTTQLAGLPTLMFFSRLRSMLSFVQESYSFSERTKYLLSNVILQSIDDGDIVKIVWKMKTTVGMQLAGPMDALLHGNIYLARPCLKRSLEVAFHVLQQKDRSRPSSWDNKLLNACFKRVPNTMRVAEPISAFLGTTNGTQFSFGGYHLHRWSSEFDHRQRKRFEEAINYLLPSWTALLIVALDCCFVLWSRGSFIHWFSPHRYSSLEEHPGKLRNRACFLHMTNALSNASHTLYEYLFELGIFPDHSIRVVSLRVDPSEANLTVHVPSASDDGDSIDQEELTIPGGTAATASNLYHPALYSASQLRLARQVFDTIYRVAEDRCD